jgi:hypothetical protein
VKVLDFGLAKAFEAMSLSQPGSVHAVADLTSPAMDAASA